jgi:hypothetical protein
MVGIKKKKKLILFLSVTLFIVCVIALTVTPETRVGVRSGRNYKVTFRNSHFREKPLKTILLWTPMFNHPTVDSYRKCLSTCEAKCVVTDDKTQIENADGVEFHLSDIWSQFWKIGTKSIIEFPKYRRPDQVWILANMEPPPHLWGNIRIFNGLFNWTRWYKSDADIHWPYGGVYIYNKSEQIEAEKELKGRNYFKEKSREMILRIGNCFDAGQRYRIINKLDRYFNIDKYGKCYNKVCGVNTDPGDESCSNLMKQYKFYLAFENDYCTDYVTEKYWLTLRRNQIPVVNWKSIDTRLVIPNSYINIFDFDSIEQLAHYLKLVSSNETLYNSYFDYKKFYTNRQSTCQACSVCQALHDKDRPAQVYTDLEGWVKDDSCKLVGVSTHCVTFVENVHLYS